MKHLSVDFTRLQGSLGLLGLLNLLPSLKAQINAADSQTEYGRMMESLKQLDRNLIELPVSELRSAQAELNQLAEMGSFLAATAHQEQEFLPFLESMLGAELAQQLVRLLAYSHDIHRKITIILSEPDPDENDPDFQRFLIELAEKEAQFAMRKPATSLRETLGL